MEIRKDRLDWSGSGWRVIASSSRSVVAVAAAAKGSVSFLSRLFPVVYKQVAVCYCLFHSPLVASLVSVARPFVFTNSLLLLCLYLPGSVATGREPS
jgi:hypothetical protein